MLDFVHVGFVERLRSRLLTAAADLGPRTRSPMEPPHSESAVPSRFRVREYEAKGVENAVPTLAAAAVE